MSTPVLSVNVESRMTGGLLAVAFEMHDELLVLLDRSGSGASALVRVIAGVAVPDSGTISVRDVVVYSSGLGINLPPADRPVGLVPRHNALFPHLRIAENVRFPLERWSPPGVEPRRLQHLVSDRVALLLNALDLAAVASRLPDEIGELDRLRAAVARALARDPEVLLLDDPLGSLTGDERLAGQRWLRDLQRRFLLPIVVTTTQPDEAVALGDRFVQLSGGRHAWDDSADSR